MSVNGFTEADLSKGGTARIFGIAFVFALLMAAVLAAFLADPGTTVAFVAAMPQPSGEHYYWQIILPGSVLGVIVGYATQRYGRRVHVARLT